MTVAVFYCRYVIDKDIVESFHLLNTLHINIYIHIYAIVCICNINVIYIYIIYHKTVSFTNKELNSSISFTIEKFIE